MDFIRNLSKLGLELTQTENERRSIWLLNCVCLVFILASLVKGASEIFESDFIGVCICFTVIFVMSLILQLNEKGYFNLTKWGMIIFSACSVSGLKILYGPELGADFIITIILALSLMFFYDIFKFGLAVLIVFITYEIGVLAFNTNGQLLVPQPSIISTYHFFFFASCICSLLVFYLAIDGERKHSSLGLIQNKTEKYKDKELEEYLEFATSNSKQMYQLIDDILSYSKIGDIDATSQNVDLNEVLMKVLGNLKSFISENNAKVDSVVLPEIKSDESRMIMLFQNIIENGIKYNRSEKPHVKILAELKKENLVISISDNGIGVDPEYHEKIFEMFTRLHNVDEFSGTGIGLATCKRIMHHTDGDIKIESNIDGGTKFILTWPISLLIKKEKKKYRYTA